jgi:hypothetical protein
MTSFGIRDWMPTGPFPRDKNDPLGWVDAEGRVHSGTWKLDKNGRIRWGKNHTMTDPGPWPRPREDRV